MSRNPITEVSNFWWKVKRFGEFTGSIEIMKQYGDFLIKEARFEEIHGVGSSTGDAFQDGSSDYENIDEMESEIGIQF